MDSVFPVPTTLSAKVKTAIFSICFKGVDVFIEYFKDTHGLEKHFKIPPSKFRYVPFKINRYEKVLEKIANQEISDDGYIFCGGNTRRDFDTLIAAATQIGYPIKIVTRDNSIISRHGSYLDESELPDNIEVIRHDASDSFLDHIARARLVVLPIKKQNITASGIGVYLAAMGLRKCVVISSGPSVNGIISDEAIVVPPENPSALAEMVKKAYLDDEFRRGFEFRGHTYAMALAGEDRLYSSLIEQLLDDKLMHSKQR